MGWQNDEGQNDCRLACVRSPPTDNSGKQSIGCLNLSTPPSLGTQHIFTDLRSGPLASGDHTIAFSVINADHVSGYAEDTSISRTFSVGSLEKESLESQEVAESIASVGRYVRVDSVPFATDVPLVNSYFTIPATTPRGQTHSRFRLHDGTTGLATTGLVPDGEVEDHLIEVLSRPDVEEIVVGDGTAQRSTVTQVTVRFESEVSAPASAFTLVNRETNTTLTNVTVATTVVNSQTVATLTFDPGTSALEDADVLGDGGDRDATAPNSIS